MSDILPTNPVLQQADNINPAKVKSVNLHLAYAANLDPFLMSWVSKFSSYNTTPRKDRKQNLYNAFNVIIANLERNYRIDNSLWTTIPLSNGFYNAGKDNPYSISASALRSILADINKLFKSKILEVSGGNKNPETGQGYYSRFRFTEFGISELATPLYGFLSNLGLTNDDTSEEHYEDSNSNNLRLIRKTLGSNPFSPIQNAIYRKIETPQIVLKAPKSEDKKSIPFKSNSETQQINNDLTIINNALEEHWVDLLIPNEDFEELVFDERQKDEYGFQSRILPGVDLLHSKRLRRIFNDGTFNNGGRFYHGWWMNIRSELRKYITINWHNTVEIDYSNLQVAMLYAREGMALEDDAYTLDGFPKTHRKLLKTAMFKIINAEGKIRPPTKSSLPEGWTWKEVLTGLEEKHSIIADSFHSGAGIELQRQDSNIANAVILRMLNEEQLVLPVHDSFIVRDGYEKLLTSVMEEEYQKAMGHPIGLKEDDRIFPKATEFELEGDKAGAIQLETRITDIENQPEYENYKQRKSDVLRLWGQEWVMRHSVVL